MISDRSGHAAYPSNPGNNWSLLPGLLLLDWRSRPTKDQQVARIGIINACPLGQLTVNRFVIRHGELIHHDVDVLTDCRDELPAGRVPADEQFHEARHGRAIRAVPLVFVVDRLVAVVGNLVGLVLPHYGGCVLPARHSLYPLFVSAFIA